MKPIIHSEMMAVVRRLDQLGLTYDVLANAVAAGYQASSNCTDLDPRNFPGITMWAVTTRHLRMALLPKNWKATNNANFSLTVSSDGKIAIAVATGDEATGIAEMVPTTQSSKGPRTVEAVAANNKQSGFKFTYPDGWKPSLRVPANFDGYATWILLIHRAQTAVRAELSYPLDLDENQRVSGWRERILLPSISIDPLDRTEFERREQPIDVPVRRKE